MPIKLHYDERDEILYCYCDKTFSKDEFKSTMNMITQSNEYPPDVKTIWDVKKVDGNSIDENFMKEIITIRNKYPQRGSAKFAIIAPSDLAFGLGRMYETLSGIEGLSQSIYVFRNHVDAKKWLLDE